MSRLGRTMITCFDLLHRNEVRPEEGCVSRLGRTMITCFDLLQWGQPNYDDFEWLLP